MGLINETPQTYYSGNDFGKYQFVSLDDIISQFMVIYVGEDKLIRNANRTDVAFHAQRGLAELSFDTLKSCKAQEISVPSSLQMILPQDYVNYTKVSWVDSTGVKHLLYPTSKTSNPTKINQNTDGTYYSNLVLNPGFQDSMDNWFIQGVDSTALGTQLSYTTSNDGLLITSNGLGTQNKPRARTPITLVDGQTYQLSWNVVGIDDGTAGASRVYLAGALGGSNSYRPAIQTGAVNGNNSLISIGPQAPIEFTFDASQNNSLNTMTLVVELKNGHADAKTVRIKDFLLVNINNDGNYGISDGGAIVDSNDSTTWSKYKSGTSPENGDNYQGDTYWPLDGSRYGLDPQHAQTNGSFYIDCVSGKIHFSSNIAGKTVILDYISDSLGTDGEMQVHKFAEEAMYKWISHAILSGKANVPEYQVNRLKKERFAAIRTAKLRLSSLKLEELTQVLRGKSKQIKH